MRLRLVILGIEVATLTLDHDSPSGIRLPDGTDPLAPATHRRWAKGLKRSLAWWAVS